MQNRRSDVPHGFDNKRRAQTVNFRPAWSQKSFAGAAETAQQGIEQKKEAVGAWKMPVSIAGNVPPHKRIAYTRQTSLFMLLRLGNARRSSWSYANIARSPTGRAQQLKGRSAREV